ncbi:MAG TPA: hypothetical protein VFJ90_05305, partial [Candidatus Didemnitutus sp.]|nr:hypothetical protein [Candidatus Didemnitutus sp.]
MLSAAVRLLARTFPGSPSWLAGWCLAFGVMQGAETALRDFSIPAGDAAVTLTEFARQSGEQIAYLSDNVRGQQTAAIQGRFVPY